MWMSHTLLGLLAGQIILTYSGGWSEQSTFWA